MPSGLASEIGERLSSGRAKNEWSASAQVQPKIFEIAAFAGRDHGGRRAAFEGVQISGLHSALVMRTSLSKSAFSDQPCCFAKPPSAAIHQKPASPLGATTPCRQVTRLWATADRAATSVISSTQISLGNLHCIFSLMTFRMIRVGCCWLMAFCWTSTLHLLF